MKRYISNIVWSILVITFVVPYITIGQTQKIGFELTTEVRRITIPFEKYNNLIIVPVLLNESIPLKFILDTGVRNAILTEKTICDLIKMEYDRQVFLSDASGNHVISAFVASNNTLSLPGVKGHSQALLVLEDDYLKLSNNIGIDVHGILGYELFKNFVVEIDYQGAELILHDPKYFKPKRSYEEFDMEVIEGKPYIFLPVGLNDTTNVMCKLMVDTGASHSLMLSTESDENISIPKKNIESVIGRGLGGYINGNLGRIADLRLKDYNLEEVIASFPEGETYFEATKYDERNGTIGGGVLYRFRVVFDYQNNKFYLKKNRFYKEPFDLNMTGIEVMADGPNLKEILVHYVREGSPADDAGIEIGDKITRINSSKVENYELWEISEMFSRKEGKTLKLEIKRGDEILTKKVELERIL
ncbi:aspartyl protease family protein [Marinigracilibium pacificum]|uniref:PDZ domain-containing protein n=1 Tax=Marinigracilibium pacificum TaxID=2729599 RepID=A0A848IUH5_9BACT|nr:aspartyl protease family protein [Marinigracilibium pacificum]NMM46945.1 PDZ domain-containing protein [Marinigracilibium pacificum]